MVLLLSAIMVGAVLGLLGAGGGVITVPALLYGAGLSPQAAIAHSLVVIGAISLFSAFREWRRGNLRVQYAIPFAMAGMVASFLAARLISPLLGEQVQMAIFCLFLGTASVLMTRNALKRSGTGREQKKLHSPARIWGVLFLCGAGVGTLSGLLGVGGGFLIVPTLVFFLGVSMNQAVATSLSIIALNSMTGAVGYLSLVKFQPSLLALFASCGIAGSVLGLGMRHRLPERVLKLVFAAVVLSVAVYLFYERVLNV